jgi:hypothetical protein
MMGKNSCKDVVSVGASYDAANVDPPLVLLVVGMCLLRGPYIAERGERLDRATRAASQCEGLAPKAVVTEGQPWVGEGCVAVTGVTVGERAVVGTKAVVTWEVRSWSVVEQVPARVIRHAWCGNGDCLSAIGPTETRGDTPGFPSSGGFVLCPC